MTDMHTVEISAVDSTSGPICSQCHRPTRIYGIEPHPRLVETDLRTYVCDDCNVTEVLVVPLPPHAA